MDEQFHVILSCIIFKRKVSVFDCFVIQASQHLQQVIASQSQELDSLREHLKKSRADLRSGNLQLAEAKKTSDQLKEDKQIKVNYK